MRGGYLATEPLGANEGFEGDVTVCLEVSPDTFGKYEVTDDVHAASGYRLALFPAAELNRIGSPQIYSHRYAGLSRRDMLQAIQRWKGEGEEMSVKASEMCNAFEFFDRKRVFTAERTHGIALW